MKYINPTPEELAWLQKMAHASYRRIRRFHLPKSVIEAKPKNVSATEARILAENAGLRPLSAPPPPSR